LCLIQLEHADAEYLATVLEPFLSPEGSIVPYQPTNTLIIRDRAPVVNMLSEVIKGKPCVHIPEQPEVRAGRQPVGAEQNVDFFSIAFNSPHPGFLNLTNSVAFCPLVNCIAYPGNHIASPFSCEFRVVFCG